MIRLLVVLGILLLVLIWPAHAQAQQATRIAPPTGPIVSGTKSCGTEAAAIAGVTSVLSVAVRNSDPAVNIVLGGSASQDFTLTPGLSLSFDVKDLAQVYCKTLASTATLEFFAVRGP